MRNMKKFVSFSVIALVVGAMSLSPIFADTVDGKDEQGSKATITFIKPDTEGPVDPVDPDPELPDPDPENPTGSEGDLTIDYAPHLTFPETELKNTVQTIKSDTLKTYVQVSDRRATGKGWKLTAELGEFVNQTDTNNKISDAKISLMSGEAFKADPKSNSAKPSVPSVIELTSKGGAKPVMTAAEGEGLGTWSATWLGTKGETENDKVVLEMNTGSAILGEYEAEVTWLLAQQP